MTGEASPVCYRKSRFEELKKGTFWLSETPDTPGLKGWGAACPQETPHTDSNSAYGKEFYAGPDYPPVLDEDCLYLNIWTPAETGDEKLPVMMWMHGGGVQSGYSH